MFLVFKHLIFRSLLHLFLSDLFYLPELLVNNEGFDFGVKQSGERVDNVLLPAWALGDPRLFIRIHRQALESEHVRGIPILPLNYRGFPNSKLIHFSGDQNTNIGTPGTFVNINF